MMDMGLQSMPTLICKVRNGTFSLYACLTPYKDKLKRTRGFYVDDFKYLKTLLRPEAGFPSLVEPQTDTNI